MKKYLYHFLLAFALILTGCEPIVDRDKLGEIVNESDLKLEVYATTQGGNKIVMVNNTPKVGSFWDYNAGKSSRQRDTILLPFLGEQYITFKGLCAGGVVTTKRKVKVDVIDHEVAAEWKLFAGSNIAGKVWMWDYTALPDPIWGNGGFQWDIGPGWTKYSAQYMKDNYPVSFGQTITFDLNEQPNFTKKNADGTVAEKGTFNFDMTKKTFNDYTGELWAKGKLELTGATVMHGIAPNHGNAPIYVYDILFLNEDKLVLAYPEPGISSGGTCWYWKFKAKR